MRTPASEFSHGIAIWLIAAAICLLPAAAAGTRDSAADTAAKIDQAVVSELSSMHGTTSKIISHVDLTGPFQTKTPWAFVIGKEPDKEGAEYPFDTLGAVSPCFVNNGSVDCSEMVFHASYAEQGISRGYGERLFYELFDSAIVYSGPRKRRPLLMLRACTMPGTNGNCGVSTFLFDYDRKADRFYKVFLNKTGRNRNEETRFVDKGPLTGHVIVAYPTDNLPYTYWVEIHKRNASGKYARSLRYRGKTEYGDGNRLAVIDSEMPEILKRLKLWKPGQPLPVPPKMPEKCTKLFMRKGVEWCE